MQIVIDIDEDVYTRLFDNGIIAVNDVCKMASAITTGTPLPKGHGRLIFEEDMLSVIMFSKLFDGAKVKEVKEVLLNIPTIIEADKKKVRIRNDKGNSVALYEVSK